MSSLPCGRLSSLLWVVLAALLVPACTDTSGAIEETPGDVAGDPASAGDTSPSTDEVGASDDVGADTLAPSVEDASDALDEDAREPTWPGCVFVDDYEVVPFAVAPRFDRISRLDFVTFRSADEFRAHLATEPPAEIDFATEWAALIARQSPWYGATFEVQSLEYCLTQINGQGFLTEAGAGCERLAARADGATLIKFAALTSPVALDVGGLGQFSTQFTCDETSPTLGATCTHQTLCQPGLLCAGLTRGDEGVCVPVTQQKTVTNSITMPVSDDGTPTVSVNTLSGLAGVDADILVEAHFDHASPSDLHIVLVRPDGERVVLWDHEPFEPHGWGATGSRSLYRAAVGFSAGAVEGPWQFEVTDDVLGNAGQLASWSLTVVTR